MIQTVLAHEHDCCAVCYFSEEKEVKFDAACCACRLKPLDIIFMKSLHHKVNIIPVIAKADMLTPLELKKLKKKVSVLLIVIKYSSGNNPHR